MWGIVLAAKANDSASGDALARLCEIYWTPLYSFVRRKGYSADQAQDLTQEFLTCLLERDYLKTVEREKGRFRTFLLSAMSHFLSNQARYERAKKRGGGAVHLSLDFIEAEKNHARVPSDDLTPEHLYERQWALLILKTAVDQVREDYRKRGQLTEFEALEPFLTYKDTGTRYAEIAQNLGKSEQAVKVAVHRLRSRFREALLREVSETVDNEQDIQSEIHHLLAALSAPYRK